MKPRALTLILVFSFFLLACSPLEVARLFGIGTKPFKTAGKVYTEVVDRDYFSAYDEVFKLFGSLRANFYRGSRQKGFAVFTNLNTSFPQCNESTEVAVFFSEIEPQKTKIEISSLNHHLSQFVAEYIFKGLKK